MMLSRRPLPDDFTILAKQAVAGQASLDTLTYLVDIVAGSDYYEATEVNRSGEPGEVTSVEALRIIWMATEPIDDPRWLDALLAVFDDPRIYEVNDPSGVRDHYGWRRLRTFRAIGAYGRVRPSDLRAVRFLIDHFDHEVTPFDQSMVVDYLGGLIKPESVDVGKLVALTTHKYWGLRNAAIKALTCVEGRDIEGVMLEAIQAFPRDESTVTYALATLRGYASEKSLSIIKPYFSASNAEVCLGALEVWAHVRGAKDTQLYLDVITASKGKASKMYGLDLLVRYGDERIGPYVIERARSIVKRRRSFDYGEYSELIQALDYLYGVGVGTPGAVKAIAWIGARPSGYLFPAERQWFLDHQLPVQA